MPEPDLIQRQREILRTFRQATARRAKVGAGADARYKAEREAADAALNKAQQEAEAQRATAEAGAEARRKAEQQAAGTTLKHAQQTAAPQLAAARDAREKAHAALSEAGLQHLLEHTRPDPPTPRPDADAARELALCASVATEASTRIPDTVEALKQWRDAAARRQQLLAAIAGVALLILTVVGAGWYLERQAEQQRQRAQAMATAEARATETAVAQAQATAAAEALVTATAVAQAQHATAEARATAIAAALQQLKDRFGMAFVYVPPGEFSMGSRAGEGDSDEHPQHTIYLDGFRIGLTEVTNAQYRSFIEAGGYQQRELWTEAG